MAFYDIGNIVIKRLQQLIRVFLGISAYLKWNFHIWLIHIQKDCNNILGVLGIAAYLQWNFHFFDRYKVIKKAATTSYGFGLLCL
jgi:hypothetical protein